MQQFDVNRQDDLIRALIAHPDNFQQSPLFALGYMTQMISSLVKKLPAEQRDLFLADVDFIIDRNKRRQQDRKAAG